MWSTAGFFQAAGMTVSTTGLTIGRSEAAQVYTFDPIRVTCGADGITEWSDDPRSRDRFIFHIRQRDNYPAAMTAALIELLSGL